MLYVGETLRSTCFVRTVRAVHARCVRCNLTYLVRMDHPLGYLGNEEGGDLIPRGNYRRYSAPVTHVPLDLDTQYPNYTIFGRLEGNNGLTSPGKGGKG